MKIVFLGTPEYAVTVLSSLCRSRRQVVAAVSQPDRARDRKGALLDTPLKKAAAELGIPVYQFENIKREGAEILRTLGPDIMITAAYGQIISREILDIPRYGVVNVHASLLPRYRGGSPVQWAILNGDKVTGVTIMQTAEGLDTGDILAQTEVAVCGDNAERLAARLAEAGAELLEKTLDKIENGDAVSRPQCGNDASRCPLLKREDGLIDWRRPHYAINNQIRGLYTWPGAYSFWQGRSVRIFAAEIAVGSGEPGTVIASDAREGLVVSCGSGSLKITELQLEGRRRMSAAEFINGYHPKVGERF